jgi:hypothetical protein
MACALAIGMSVAPAAFPQQSHVIVITGLSGGPDYAQRFGRWAGEFVGAAEKRWSVPRSSIAYLSEDSTRAGVTGRSSRAGIEAAVAAVAERARPDDIVLILILGHGTAQGGEARLNLPGPDMSATDFAKLLDRLSAQRVALINAASASGDFVAPLSGKNRTIVTATRSGGEKNETIFGEYFVHAFAGEGADADKDGQVSLLEAFNYARHEVARFYQSENRLQTEHALLDDNGDGEGSREPDPSTGDGATARRFVLARTQVAGADAESSDPALAPLFAQRRQLEEQVATLRGRKASMDSTAYETELEHLLVELATMNQQIRAKESRP